MTLPDGTTVKGVPDGTSKADLATKLRANGRTVPDSWMAPSGSPSDRIPRDSPESMGLPPNAPSSAPAPEPSVMDRIKGLPGAALSMATAIPAGVAGNIAGAAETLTGGNYGTPVGAMQGHERAQKVSEALTYQPRTAGGQANVESAGKALQASGVAGINPAAVPMMPGAGRAAGKGAMKVRDAIAESPEADLVKRGAGAVGKAMPSVDTETRALARKAQEFGIEIPPHKLSDNRFVRLVGEALDNVPAAGSVGEKNQVAFNSALGKMIGAPDGTKRITRGVYDQALSQSGKTIGGVSERTPVPVAPGSTFDTALFAVVDDAKASGLQDVEKMIGSHVDELRAAAKDGVIDGKAFRRLNTKIQDKMRGMGGDRKTALQDLHEHMMDALLENVSPADKESLLTARRQYAIANQIEPLVAKAPKGDIPPSQLMGVLTRDKAGKRRQARGAGGDLGDLADVAQMFMKDQPSTITAERGLAYGALGAGAFEPMTAATVYGGANLYNRLGPKVTRRMLAKDAPNIPVSEIPE